MWEFVDTWYCLLEFNNEIGVTLPFYLISVIFWLLYICSPTIVTLPFYLTTVTFLSLYSCNVIIIKKIVDVTLLLWIMIMKSLTKITGTILTFLCVLNTKIGIRPKYWIIYINRHIPMLWIIITWISIILRN